MNIKNSFLVLLQLLIHFLIFTITTEGSNITQNLNTILSSLSSNINSYGFYSTSVGENSDKINTIVLCRGDIHLDTCRACINNSTRKVLELYANQTETTLWYDNCMLRYSNKSIIGNMVADPSFYSSSVENVTSTNQFNQTLRTLLNSLRDEAASGQLRKFAAGNRSATNVPTIYALVQCTPDLSRENCSTCIDKAVGYIPTCFSGRKGGRVVGPSCNFRFENYRFFEAQQLSGGKDSKTRIIIIIVIALVSSSIMLIVCACCYIRKQKKKLIENLDSEPVQEINTVKSLQYDFITIRDATSNFSDANKLGQGGFGAVYKGQLPNGQEIAVKRLSTGSGQGDTEFENEVLLVAKLQHRNLVRLLGFSLEGSERLLIYEFMPNSSLDKLLFDPVHRADLDWDRRYKIIEGVTKGLLYLHEDSRFRIIHRDLKASNVLLDAEMNPKIADFGMARLFVMDETQGDTNRIVGTYGYMAPEYAMFGQFSIKSDVFSFGVLVLEIVCGKKYNYSRNREHAENLPSYAWKTWRDGKAEELIDPILIANSESKQEIMRCIHICLLCVQQNLADRPTMSKVLLMLNSSSLALPVPSEPAFLIPSSQVSEVSRPDGENDSRMSERTSTSASGVSSASVNEVSITQLYPR